MGLELAGKGHSTGQVYRIGVDAGLMCVGS